MNNKPVTRETRILSFMIDLICFSLLSNFVKNDYIVFFSWILVIFFNGTGFGSILFKYKITLKNGTPFKGFKAVIWFLISFPLCLYYFIQWFEPINNENNPKTFIWDDYFSVFPGYKTKN